MTAVAANRLSLIDALSTSARKSHVAWVLFLALNATLFLRPAEIVPQLEGLPIYNVIIVCCLIAAAPLVVARLQLRRLAVNPITLCVFGMLSAIVLSLLAQGETWYAREYGTEFVKVVLYYLLLVSLVSTPRRLRQFLLALAIFALLLNVVALLSYYKIVDLATVSPMEEGQYQTDADQERVVVVRLVAAGIYGNPNDLARIIIVGITVCLFAVARARFWPGRAIWIAVLAVFAHALQLTYSRGGLIALIAGILVLLHARFGMKRGGVLLLLLVPALVLFSGRQTDIDTDAGTAQLRIKLWSEGLVALRSSPLFGIGTDHYFRTAGNHAHNSFVEAYVETGVFGGTFFTSAFVLAVVGLFRSKQTDLGRTDPELSQMRPYVLSLVVGTIVGQCSSSREYSLPTYMILGVATAYLSLAADRTPALIVRASPRLAVRLGFFSLATLLLLHLYTKFNAHFG